MLLRSFQWFSMTSPLNASCKKCWKISVQFLKLFCCKLWQKQCKKLSYSKVWYAIIRYECTFHIQLRLFPWPSHLSDSVFLLDNLKYWSHSYEDVDVTLSSSLLGVNHGTAYTRSGVSCIKKEAIVAFSLWI